MCRAEGYVWNQTVYDVEGDAFINTNFSGQAKFGFQMDMCRNVSKVAYPSACKTAAPAYMVSACFKHTCILNSLLSISACFLCMGTTHVQY